MTPGAVIYAFRSPGSGAVYIGKHECDPSRWPRRGSGRLPDGYAGGGKAVARFHARHGERVEWRILAVVAPGDWPRAERRAIRLARALFGQRCVNVLAGGPGLTISEAKRQWADPAWRARRVASLHTPDVKAKKDLARRRAKDRKTLIALIRPPLWASPGLTVWDFHPGAPLNVTGVDP